MSVPCGASGPVAWHAVLGAVICLCARVQHPGRLPAPSRRYDVPAGLLMAASLLFCHLSPAAGRMGRMGCFQFNRVYVTLQC